MKILSEKVFQIDGVTYNIDALTDEKVKQLTGKSKKELIKKEKPKESSKKKQSTKLQKNLQEKKVKS